MQFCPVWLWLHKRRDGKVTVLPEIQEKTPQLLHHWQPQDSVLFVVVVLKWGINNKASITTHSRTIQMSFQVWQIPCVESVLSMQKGKGPEKIFYREREEWGGGRTNLTSGDLGQVSSPNQPRGRGEVCYENHHLWVSSLWGGRRTWDQLLWTHCRDWFTHWTYQGVEVGRLVWRKLAVITLPTESTRLPQASHTCAIYMNNPISEWGMECMKFGSF